MATKTTAHAEPVNDEAPTQGVFIGYLAMALFVIAVAVAALGLIVGASHGWQ